KKSGSPSAVEQLEKVKEEWVLTNAALNQQILSENEAHEFRKGTIIETGYGYDIKDSQDAYNREKTIRNTAFLEELNSITSLQEAKELLKDSLSVKELKQLTTLEAAKKALQEQFNIEELDRQKEYLDSLLKQL